MNAWTLFHVRGIPVRAHLTLLIAIPYFALIIALRFTQAASMADVDASRMLLPPLAWGILLSVGLFACIALHEMAHALFAIRAGRQVKGITLMLLGGVSEIPEDLREEQSSSEAVIAVVGPVMSLVLALLLYAAHDLVLEFSDLRFGFFYLAQINLSLAVFNLLPAFPLDGGRVLRALLARRFGRVRATGISVQVGKVFAILFIVGGVLVVNILLLLIGLFIYAYGTREKRVLEFKQLITGLRIGDVMRPASQTAPVTASASVSLVLSGMLERKETRVPVLYDGRKLLGVAELQKLVSIPEEQRNAVPAGMVANTDVLQLKVTDSAELALESLFVGDRVIAVVAEDGRFEGLLQRDDLVKSLEMRRSFKPPRAA